jgi:DNA-binding GntR family transcriptional regulator
MPIPAARRSIALAPGPSTEPRTLVDAAYTRIRTMLVERTLTAGSTITEAQFVREFGMSRTPVREALTRLAGEGYIRPASGRGFVIAELTAQDVVNVYAVRAQLEGFAAGEAAGRIRRVELAQLEDLYDDMQDAIQAADDERLAQLTSTFHKQIAAASGNGYLEAMLDETRKIFDLYRPAALAVPGRRGDAHAEHGQLIEALRTHDPDLARRLAQQHVVSALAARQSVIQLNEHGA